MKVAVFSDVHGNLPALEKFIGATAGSVDRYVCLGDVVNYGPWNDECLELVMGLPGITCLEGNHERLFLGRDDAGDELPLVQEFMKHSMLRFSRHDLIGALPEGCGLGRFKCSHTVGGRTVYADTPIEICGNTLIGHAHHQYNVRRSGFSLVNPGSVGQNRKWIDVVDYLVIDTETDEIGMCSIPYDVDAFIAELRARAYPGGCVSYYANKARATP